VQLVALGRIEKQPGHRVQAVFGAFRFLQTEFISLFSESYSV